MHPHDQTSRPPLVGITTDVTDHPNGRRVFSYMPYARAVAAAGGLPLMLPPVPETIPAVLDRIDAFVFTGGDDPRTEPFGVPTDPRATPLHPDRQQFEVALLQAVGSLRPDTPVLGVCLGMQLQALIAGGRLDQHMPESHLTHADHWEHDHPVQPVPGAALPLDGMVRSKHRQAVADPGSLTAIAHAPDGVIEAIHDPARRFWVGVQWHPERTGDTNVGAALFHHLIRAVRADRPQEDHDAHAR